MTHIPTISNVLSTHTDGTLYLIFDPLRNSKANEFWQTVQHDHLGLSVEDLTIPKTNFRAQVYMPDPEVFGENAKPTLVFKGTSFTSGTDWWHGNLTQGMGLESKYYRQAVDIGQKILDTGRQVDITGHSLGGGLASAASKASSMTATTFNAAGLHYDTVEKYGVPKALQGADELITRYRITGEILTYAQENIPLVNLMPDAVGTITQNLVAPRTLDVLALSVGSALGIKSGIVLGITGYLAVKAYEKVDLHSMGRITQAIETRKVQDLHLLAKESN